MDVQPVGKLEVTCLLDAAGAFTLGLPAEVFPDATEADWAAARRIDPRAFGADGRWRLSFHCFVVREPGHRVTLVDTGIGPTGSPASDWAPVPGRLPHALAEHGIDVTDVDLVVQTHLHTDHLGWSVGADGAPLFPRARYVIQRAEIAALERAGSALVPDVVEPLRRTDQLHEADGEVRLVGGHGRAGHRVVAIPTSGHTPGHQSVLVEDGDEQLVITGDVLLHAVQLANPNVGYTLDDDQERARATRRTLLSRARRDDALLATPHLNLPFVPVP